MYSECCPAKRGNISLEESPSAPWHRKQEPEIIFLALASSACAKETELKLMTVNATVMVWKNRFQRMTQIYAKLSAQILRAQAMAYLPSSSLAALETPPEPGTVNMVFLSAS